MIKWETPSPDANLRVVNRYRDEVEALKAHPHRWWCIAMDLTRNQASSLSGSIRRGDLQAFSAERNPEGTFQSKHDGRSVWARFCPTPSS